MKNCFKKNLRCNNVNNDNVSCSIEMSKLMSKNPNQLHIYTNMH